MSNNKKKIILLLMTVSFVINANSDFYNIIIKNNFEHIEISLWPSEYEVFEDNSENPDNWVYEFSPAEKGIHTYDLDGLYIQYKESYVKSILIYEFGWYFDEKLYIGIDESELDFKNIGINDFESCYEINADLYDKSYTIYPYINEDIKVIVYITDGIVNFIELFLVE